MEIHDLKLWYLSKEFTYTDEVSNLKKTIKKRERWNGKKKWYNSNELNVRILFLRYLSAPV